MADTIKCTSCGSNLTFNPDLQMLECVYCGVLLDPRGSKADSAINQLKLEEALEEEVFSEDEKLYQRIICNSCGAELVTDFNTSATFCVYCGSPLLSVQKLTKQYKPKYIIPFKINKNDTERYFLKWCRGGRFTPFGFTSRRNIEKLKGIYVPYWLFDVEGNLERIGEAVVEHTRGYSGGKTVTIDSEYYEIERQIKVSWKNIPLNASKRLDNELMEAIEPYVFYDLVDYDYKYLPGFYAEAYDLSSKSLTSRISKRIDAYFESEYKASTSGFKHASTLGKGDVIDSIEASYALFPIWFMNYKFNGKTHTFIMNGQTGAIAGIPPVSKLKAVLVGLEAFAIILLLIKAIIWLFIW